MSFSRFYIQFGPTFCQINLIGVWRSLKTNLLVLPKKNESFWNAVSSLICFDPPNPAVNCWPPCCHAIPRCGMLSRSSNTWGRWIVQVKGQGDWMISKQKWQRFELRLFDAFGRVAGAFAHVCRCDSHCRTGRIL